MKSNRIPWFAAGNNVTGFIAIGNVVTGVIAIGNVARGVIAIGNVATGVIAIGNVGFGLLFGAGASVGVGLFSIAAALALPVFYGFSAASSSNYPSLFQSIVPIILWILYAKVFSGEKKHLQVPTPMISLKALRKGNVEYGWCKLKLSKILSESLLLYQKYTHVELKASSKALEQAKDLSIHRKIYAYLQIEQRPKKNDHSRLYRESPKMEQTIICTDIEAVPKGAPWIDKQHFDWWLSRFWLFGAIIGSFLVVLLFFSSF